jgi:glycosyltransferase involved in cell wall biosynthesis
MESIGKKETRRARHVLMIVENLPVPFDTRVWQEAQALKSAGYDVSIICPATRGYDRKYEILQGIFIHRHSMPTDAAHAMAFAVEYVVALFWEMFLAFRIFKTRRFDVIHACNPPDTIFVVAGVFKILFGTKFVFDHHDLCPELYEAKFGRRGLLYHTLVLLEGLTFRISDISIATNGSYREVAIKRGRKAPDDIIVVRSGPDMNRLRAAPGDSALKCGKAYLVTFIGVIGKQEGVKYLIEAAFHIVYELGRTDVHFAIVGGGSDLETAKTYAHRLELDSYFTFTGRVPDALLLAMANTADVCVNCDEWNPMNDKSTMNKVMEYMALAKPIVQFDLKEGRVSAEEAAVYARPNDAIDFARKIVDLLDDPEKRAVMGEFGRQRVENCLAWHHQAPKLLAAYELLWSRANASEKRRWRWSLR